MGGCWVQVVMGDKVPEKTFNKPYRMMAYQRALGKNKRTDVYNVTLR